MDYESIKKLAMLQMERNKDPSKSTEMTPEEKDYYNKTVGAMAGSLSPIGTAAGAVGETAEEAIRRNALNQATDGGANMTTIQKLQQPLSRAVDFADRTKKQLQQVKFDRIKQYLGR